MDVTTEKKDRVWTVIIDRPEARNAVNRQTADQLVEAFLQFDQNDHAAVAVLWEAGGTFCADADLKAGGKIPVRTSALTFLEEMLRQNPPLCAEGDSLQSEKGPFHLRTAAEAAERAAAPPPFPNRIVSPCFSMQTIP